MTIKKPGKGGYSTRKTADKIIADLGSVEIISTPDAFDPKKSRITIHDTASEEKFRHDTDMLKLEWAVKYPGLTPAKYLETVRGYAYQVACNLVSTSGGVHGWERSRAEVNNALTKSVVKRHVDLMAEVQEQHISGGKIALARAMEMLAAGGMKVKDSSGAEQIKPLRSVDIMNLAAAIKTAQEIYRRAMGLGTDEGGLQSILDAINAGELGKSETHNHLHIHSPKEAEAVSAEEDKKRRSMEGLTYEQLQEIIEFRRQQRAKEAKEADAAKKREGLPPPPPLPKIEGPAEG